MPICDKIAATLQRFSEHLVLDIEVQFGVHNNYHATCNSVAQSLLLVCVGSRGGDACCL